jgi:enoyl-CoA hydratase/carnithine racemase
VEYEHLKFSVQDGIALITLDRPEAMNAFTSQMLESWFVAITKCEQSEEIRAVILTGAGKAFCAGGDIKDFLSQDLRAWDLKNFLQEKVHRVALAMDGLHKPIIAALNGAARGAGMDMALFCDIRIASERASLSESYIKLGIAPGDGGAFSLPRIVGPAKALEWLLTGNPIGVDEALRFGLINKVVPHDRLMEEAYLMARTIADHSPLAVRLTKRAVKQALNSDLRDHLDYISSQMGLLCETEHFREAVRRFIAGSGVSEEETP